eukprot:COSAG05_NODE_1709_length_4237_cov_14.296762_2_plen_163_part_00
MFGSNFIYIDATVVYGILIFSLCVRARVLGVLIGALRSDVERLATMRLEFEKKAADPAVTEEGGQFFGNPTGYALHKYRQTVPSLLRYFVCRRESVRIDYDLPYITRTAFLFLRPSLWISLDVRGCVILRRPQVQLLHLLQVQQAILWWRACVRGRCRRRRL